MSETQRQPIDLGLTYEQALHGVQTGVQLEISRGGQAASPKHLRTGLESSQVNAAALASLLISKGLFTTEEYAESVRLWMNNELALYEARANGTGGPRVNLR